MWGLMGFPVGAFLEDRSCISPFCFMFALWKGTVVGPGKLSSAFVSVFTLSRFSFPLWMDVCYTRYMLDVRNVFHIYVDSKYMWMFFLLLLTVMLKSYLRYHLAQVSAVCFSLMPCVGNDGNTSVLEKGPICLLHTIQSLQNWCAIFFLLMLS